MKKLISLFLVIFLMALVACGGGNGGNKKTEKTVSDLQKCFNDTISEYKEANDVEFKITLVSTNTTEISVKYSIKDNKVESLASIAKDADGEVSVYVKDNVAYMARYNNEKTSMNLASEDATKIASEYRFDAYFNRAAEIFNASFFNASALEKVSDTEYDIICDLTALEVDESLDGEEYLQAQEDIENLMSLSEVSLKLFVDGEKVTKMVGSFAKDGGAKSTITVEFISLDPVTVTVPDASSYKAQ